MQIRISTKHVKKSEASQSTGWLKRLWTTIAALGFLVFAFFFFSFFIALFLSILATALIYGIWLQSKFEKKKSGRIIETDYVVISEEEQEARSPKKE
jgi:fatty acid desaturase